jgi:signal transduction histidine kinase/DNA-binding NarL/FixJ family response regulator
VPADARLPTHRRRPAGGLHVIGAVLVMVLAAAVWVQWRQLSLSQQALRTSEGYGVLSVYQLEYEYLRLVDAWHQELAGRAERPGALRLRYDLWVSRIALARTPSLQRLTQDDAGVLESLTRIQRFVQRTDSLWGEATEPPPGLLESQLAPLESLADAVHTVTLTATHRIASRNESSNAALEQQSRLGIALTVSLMALCAAFAIIALRQMRLLHERQVEQEHLTERLREARRQAEAANAVKGAFLADMSHEIRTPFQGLMGMLALVKDSPLSPPQAEQLRLAYESGEHLLRILNDILDLTQLQSGRLTLHQTALDLPRLLGQVEAVMRPAARAKSLPLQLDTDPTVPRWIVGDATRVRQVLFNLLSNAIKFSERGNVALDVRRQPVVPPKLQFVVTDTGIGMDRATAEGLFDRFDVGQRPAWPPPRDRRGGAGLGLDISRKLARLMGGDITVHSVPGEGSRFVFELPLVEPETAPVSPEPAAAETAAALRPLRVLVAEDHPVNRQYLASLLDTLHHRPHFVANGRDAVLAVQSQVFDLVLMDLHMPEMDGIDATRAIRALADPQAATVPIVALTADAFAETRERCILAGMNDFLTKPVSPQDLATALRRLFGQDAADVQSAPATPATAPPMAPYTDLIDAAAAGRLLEGLNPQRVSDLIESYLAQGPQTVERMRAAVRDGQPLELRAQAHAARGAALNLGLAALAQTAQALHEGATHLPAHEIVHLVQRFESLLPRTRQAALDAGLLVLVQA